MFINQHANCKRVSGSQRLFGHSNAVPRAAGAKAGALGWWSNLRSFSLDRFAPSVGGGRLPIQRYLSLALLNRIAFFEFDQLRKLLPAVANKLPTDSLYDQTVGSEPQRNREVLQSWEAVKTLNDSLVADEQSKSLKNCSAAVAKAMTAYEAVQAASIRLDGKSNRNICNRWLKAFNYFATGGT